MSTRVALVRAPLGAAFLFACVAGSSARADDSASPVPVPTASYALHVVTDGSFTGIEQHTIGPGQVGPEAAGFAGGSPLSPNVPYDFFSSAPQVPGIAAIAQIVSTVSYRTPHFEAGLTAGYGTVHGSVTNAAYWGENLLPTLNPHLGSQALPYTIAFPRKPGEDDGSNTRLSILGGTLATSDGNLRLRGGWFDLAQTDRFAFAPPALTNANPAIAYAPAESISSGVASASFWQPASSALPLQGLDLIGKRDDATLELTSAALPSLPGESARLTMGSLVFDRGEGTRFSAQIVHATTSGIAFATTVPNGTDPAFLDSPQGLLPTSMLSGQRQTIAGVRAAFHLLPKRQLDGVVEIGRAWYDAAPVDRPGTQAPGGYYHAGVIEMQGRITASLDLFREEPRYATLILPYGIPENQWSAAFAWPGNWLKSNYQLVDNSVLGVNREGYRLRYSVDGGPLEVRLEYTNLRQIDPETTATATQSGYVDGYYLPQAPNAATFGRQQRYGFWTAWHPAIGTFALDIVDDELFRPFAPGHVSDRVSYEVPQAVVTFDREISKNVHVATGLGRYAMKGSFDEPIDIAERLFFLGTEVRETKATSLLVTFRRTAVEGTTTLPTSPLEPAFTGSAIVVEQRVHL